MGSNQPSHACRLPIARRCVIVPDRVDNHTIRRADLEPRNHRCRRTDPDESILQTYRLRVAFREKRGVVRAPARDETIQAANLREAISAVLGEADSLLIAGTNLAWLTDREDNLMWTLRMDEHNAEST